MKVSITIDIDSTEDTKEVEALLELIKEVREQAKEKK